VFKQDIGLLTDAICANFPTDKKIDDGFGLNILPTELTVGINVRSSLSRQFTRITFGHRDGIFDPSLRVFLYLHPVYRESSTAWTLTERRNRPGSERIIHPEEMTTEEVASNLPRWLTNYSQEEG
jgi:hypothetical protein